MKCGTYSKMDLVRKENVYYSGAGNKVYAKPTRERFSSESLRQSQNHFETVITNLTKTSELQKMYAIGRGSFYLRKKLDCPVQGAGGAEDGHKRDRTNWGLLPHVRTR